MDLFGSLIDLAGQGISDLFSAWQVRDAQDWQQGMENSRYQRAVKDMRAAGLNPALMMGSGSPAPAGGGPAPAKGSDYGRAAQTALQYKQGNQQVDESRERERKEAALADDAETTAYISKLRRDLYKKYPEFTMVDELGRIGSHGGSVGGIAGLASGAVTDLMDKIEHDKNKGSSTPNPPNKPKTTKNTAKKVLKNKTNERIPQWMQNSARSAAQSLKEWIN